MKRLFSLLLIASLCPWLNLQPAVAQDTVVANLRQYISQFTNPLFPNLGTITVEDLQTDALQKTVTVVLSDNFIA